MNDRREEPAALVACAGRQGLAVTRGLGERGVRVVVLHWDDDDLARLSRYAAETVRTPAPEIDGEAFVDRLLSLASRYPGAVLIPTTDGAVKDIARRRTELERHFIVDCPSWEVAEKFIDKRHTYELADELGIAIPRTLIPDGPADLESAAATIGFPCLVKPRESHLWTAQLEGKFTVANSGRELRDNHAVARDAGLEIMLQELIPGPDRHGVNYNAHRSSAGILAECTARKIRQGPPRSGLPRVVLSARVPEIVEPGRRLLDALGIEGFACTEFKYDARDRTYKLLEVNGRHNLSSLLSIRCGVNFPWISYRHLIAGEVWEPIEPRSGVYWIDEWLDIAYSRTQSGRDSQDWRQIARPWLDTHVFAVFDPNDLAPFGEVARAIVRDAARVARRAVGRPSN